MTVRLADLTTLRVGGPAARMLDAASAAELVDAALEAWGDDEPWLVLGGGSNLVVADEGFPGTVIRVLGRGIEVLERSDGRVRLRVAAGESWDELVATAVGNGWAGIEALSGIPGCTGAAPIQNIGAYGQELSETLVAIDFLDHESGEVSRLPAVELGLGYRTSAIKRGRQGVVLGIEIELHEGPSAPVGYAQLAASLGVDRGARVPLAELRAAVLALRASKGMVLDPNDPDSVSAGSFFTNPIVDEAFAHGLPTEAPRFAASPERTDVVRPLGADPAPVDYRAESRVKLSAAWLIERAGIRRGFALPGSRAAISSKHTLAITNTGEATAEEIVQLARYVQMRVLAEFGVRLAPEPNLVGIQL